MGGAVTTAAGWMAIASGTPRGCLDTRWWIPNLGLLSVGPLGRAMLRRSAAAPATA